MNEFFENRYRDLLRSNRPLLVAGLLAAFVLIGALAIALLALQPSPAPATPPSSANAAGAGTVGPTSTSLRQPTLTSVATEAPPATPTPQSYPVDGADVPAAQPTASLNTPEAMSEVRQPYLGIWISGFELAHLPTSGPAWEHLREEAEGELREPKLRNKDESNNIYLLAKALVYARTGESGYREEIIDNLMEAIDTEDGGRTLALGRNLLAYVLAADLVNLPADPEKDEKFRAWLRETLTEKLDQSMTLQSTHEERPNNWGTHAGASRAAVALYLQDDAELERTAQVFKGWLGDRDAYAGFVYGDLYWQADPENPVAINPLGATKEGYSIDGALPEEMRRGGKFQWPPKETNYAWGALQGALVQAEILCRAGYPTWEWQDRALLRAVEFLYELGWEPEGDDIWQPWLVNYAYNTDFPAPVTTRPGKNMGWTDWTHSEFRPPRGQFGGC